MFLFRTRLRAEPITSFSKEYIEHLRSVHFGLVVISVGLLTLILSSKPYNIRTAYKQISDITELQREWKPDSLERLATNAIIQKKGSSFTDGVKECTHIKINPGTAKSIPTGARYTLQFDRSWNATFDFRDSEGRYVHQEERFPETVHDFELWWNTLQNGIRFYQPALIDPRGKLSLDISPDARLISQLGNQYPEFEVSCTVESFPNDMALQLRTGVDGPKGEDPGKVYGLTTIPHDPPFGGAVVFQIIAAGRLSVKQDVFTARFKWKPGSFAESFADLSTATEGVDSITLQDLRKQLYDDLSKGTGVFEAFGVKFPTNQITTYGLILIVTIQLYLFIYMRRLPPMIESEHPSAAVPWLGMDGSRLARSAFFLSIVILPCVTIGALWRAYFWITIDSGEVINPSTKLASVFISLLSIILAIFAWRKRPRIIQGERINDSRWQLLE